jgi:P-type Ca2+ transporter type 2C
MDWHTLSKKEVLDEFNSSENGLDKNQVLDNLQKYGENRLEVIRRFNALKIFIDQFRSFLIFILIIAVVLSFLLNRFIDSITIMVILIANASIGFFQEYRADKAIKELKKMMVPESKVIREGRIIKISSYKIVPGDILYLNEGDHVTADARILESNGLKINEASLTGESVPSEKITQDLDLSVPLGNRVNMVYQGTHVVSGSGKAVVVSTGMETELGKISTLVQKIEPERSPLTEKLDSFSRKIGIFILILSCLVGIVLYLNNITLEESILSTISLAVSAVPEGLPVILSLGLAFATRRMLKKKVLIRKLPASETLGMVTVICTDKTGTLTEEKMEVTSIYANNKFSPSEGKEMLLKIGVLCNNAKIEKDENGKEYYIGDPTELALLFSARNDFLIKEDLIKKEKKVKEFAFNSERKMMSIIRKKDNKLISYVKGAPEEIIKRCSYELINNKKIKLNEEKKKVLIQSYEEMAKQGLRVLGFAYKELSKTEKISDKNAESNLIFVGFQGMIDPPRPEVKKSIRLCNEAGIKVIMVTGDSKLTADAVAKKIGLEGRRVDSTELSKMSDRELFDGIKTISVFSRISPEDKLRIINVLKKRNEIVAMTGDGVNDAPALKRADIGISMGIRGTDVARDSSDIIILDDNFASIVEGVKEGRRVYDNIKKFIKYLFSCNFYEVFLVAIAVSIGLGLPLLPLQILWINLVTDSFPALSLGSEEIEKKAMNRKPDREGILKGTGGFIILAGLIGFIITFVMFYFNLDQGIDKARTITLATSVIYQMFLVFNCKSDSVFFRSPKNKYIFIAVFGTIIAQLFVIYWIPIASIFSFVPLSLVDWLKIVGISILGSLVLESTKVTRDFFKKRF